MKLIKYWLFIINHSQINQIKNVFKCASLVQPIIMSLLMYVNDKYPLSISSLVFVKKCIEGTWRVKKVRMLSLGRTTLTTCIMMPFTSSWWPKIVSKVSFEKVQMTNITAVKTLNASQTCREQNNILWILIRKLSAHRWQTASKHPSMLFLYPLILFRVARGYNLSQHAQGRSRYTT